jgi:hypothetical protein
MASTASTVEDRPEARGFAPGTNCCRAQGVVVCVEMRGLPLALPHDRGLFDDCT